MLFRQGGDGRKWGEGGIPANPQIKLMTERGGPSNKRKWARVIGEGRERRQELLSSRHDTLKHLSSTTGPDIKGRGKPMGPRGGKKTKERTCHGKGGVYGVSR